MRKNILIQTVALCCLLFEGSAKASLNDILSKYCVPKSASNCTGNVRATYNSGNGLCECNSRYMHYKVADRECEDCITGSFASSDFKTCEPLKCPSGYEAKLVTNGNCPSGYSLHTVTNNNCPSGSNLKSYSITSKIWN